MDEGAGIDGCTAFGGGVGHEARAVAAASEFFLNDVVTKYMAASLDALLCAKRGQMLQKKYTRHVYSKTKNI